VQKINNNEVNDMKENITWLTLWCKRLIQKPLLLFTILLMPLTALFLQQCSTKQDAVLRVALYLEPGTAGISDDEALQIGNGKELLEHITSLSDASISFYVCRDKSQLIRDLKSRKANCGYLIPSDLEKKIPDYIEKRKPFLTVVRGKKDVTTRILDEIVLSKNYGAIAYHIMESFLEKRSGTEPDRTELLRTFKSHSSNELLFQFQYLNGEENTILQEKSTNILMLPLRGIVAAILLITCMAGELLCFQDREEGKYSQMTRKQRGLANLYSLLIPGTAACISALLSLKIAGISSTVLRELPAMACYLFACLGLAALLGKLLPRQSIYLASMPVMLLLSLILSPIFIDLGILLPAVKKMGNLLPTTWYLNSIQSSQNLLYLLAYGGVCLLLCFLAGKLPCRFPQHHHE